MSNGRESEMTPEQEAREEQRRAQLRNNKTDEEIRLRDAYAESYATNFRDRPNPGLPEVLPTVPRYLPTPILDEWFANHPTFRKNDGMTMIPSGSIIALFDDRLNNPIETVQTSHDLFFPKFYMGKKIVGVKRNAGGRRSRKSRHSRKRSRNTKKYGTR